MPLFPSVCDHFGQQYTLLPPGQSQPHSALRPESFATEFQAKSFIYQLQTPPNFWHRIYLESTYEKTIKVRHNELINEVACMLYRGVIRVFKQEKQVYTETQRISYTSDDKNEYKIQPVSYLLENRYKEIRTIKTREQAQEFIEQSAASDEELTALLREQKLDTKTDSKEATVNALVSGELIVTISPVIKVVKPDSTLVTPEPRADKAPDLGPPPEKSNEASSSEESEQTETVDKEANLSENGDEVVPNTFNPAKRTGLDFDTSVRELPNGLQEIKLKSNQVILNNGSLTVPSRPNPNGAFNLIDSRFNPTTGDLNVDYVFTFNKGKGVGSELISRAVETAGSQNVKSIVGRLGADNRRIFDSGVAQGLSPLEAVLKTPAAKIRQNLGFKNLGVTFDENGNPILRGSR